MIKCYLTYLYPDDIIRHSKVITFSSQYSLDKLIQVLKDNVSMSIHVTLIR